MSFRAPTVTPADVITTPGLGLSRRAAIASLSSLAAPAAWLAVPQVAHAGGQLEEPLMDSVRTALSSAVANQAPPEPEFFTTEARLHYLRWLGTQSDRLRRRKPEWEVRRGSMLVRTRGIWCLTRCTRLMRASSLLPSATESCARI